MDMKTLNNNHSGKFKSKGDRLKWTPLEEIHSVPLTEENTEGRHLTSEELTKGKDDDKSKFLVP